MTRVEAEKRKDLTLVVRDTNEPTRPLRIAVIGTGLIGRKHIELIAGNPDFELVATVNPSGAPDYLPPSADIPNFPSCDALLAGCPIEAAIIASPNETHADIAVQLIEAGIPVLVEKPIAGSLADAARIIAAAEHHAVPVLMGHHRRYNPIISEMRGIIDSGRQGALVGFSGVWSVYKPDPYFDAAWRTGPTGGPIMINLIHELDYLQAMIGRIETVGAMQAPKRRRQGSEEAVGVLLRFECGVIGSVMLSDSAASPWSWEQATGENDPAFPMNRQNPYRFLFERGAVEFPEMKVWSQAEPDWGKPFETETGNRLVAPMRCVFARQIAHFHEVASGAAQPLVSARDGMAALAAAIAVKQAIADGDGFRSVQEL